MDESFIREYRALRRETGYPANVCHGVVKNATRVRQWERDHVEFPTWEGGWQVHPITGMDDGLHYTVRILVDTDAGRPEDNGDCYDDDDVKAWERDEWHYHVVTVECADPRSGADGEDTLGGIDAGSYWTSVTLLDTDQQVLSAVLDYGMLGNARSNLLDALHVKARAENDARDAVRGLPMLTR